MQQQAKGRGGDVKKAPSGFYTAKEARQRLGLKASTFQTKVAKGEIKRIVPPLHSEGFYPIEDIDKLAYQQDLFYLQNVSSAKYEKTTFGKATASDADGIFNVLASLWGAENATPADIRRSWYKVNARIDYVVKFRSLVLGYINITPYAPEILEELMAGRKRGWDVKPHEILTFEPGKAYNCFTGIAVRQDIPGHEYYAKRLIYGFFGELANLAREGIIIRHMCATSDQPYGIKISQDLGFERQPEKPGDKFGRFVLNMETANTVLVRKYREVVQKQEQQPIKRIPSRILRDPQIESMLQSILETVTSREPTLQEAATAFLALTDQLADSPQMTIEQQVLLRSIHETLTQRSLT